MPERSRTDICIDIAVLRRVEYIAGDDAELQQLAFFHLEHFVQRHVEQQASGAFDAVAASVAKGRHRVVVVNALC